MKQGNNKRQIKVDKETRKKKQGKKKIRKLGNNEIRK